jgi:hypothetical protein
VRHRRDPEAPPRAHLDVDERVAEERVPIEVVARGAAVRAPGSVLSATVTVALHDPSLRGTTSAPVPPLDDEPPTEATT